MSKIIVLEIEVESGVVDPLKLHHLVEAIERNNRRRADTDRWIVRRQEIKDQVDA